MVPAEKFLHSGCIAECFRSTTVSGRECSTQVSIGQARGEICSSENLVEESGVEAIPRANRIDDGNWHGGRAEPVAILNSNGPVGSHLDHDGLYHL